MAEGKREIIEIEYDETEEKQEVIVPESPPREEEEEEDFTISQPYVPFEDGRTPSFQSAYPKDIQLWLEIDIIFSIGNWIYVDSRNPPTAFANGSDGVTWKTSAYSENLIGLIKIISEYADPLIISKDYHQTFASQQIHFAMGKNVKNYPIEVCNIIAYLAYPLCGVNMKNGFSMDPYCVNHSTHHCCNYNLDICNSHAGGRTARKLKEGCCTLCECKCGSKRLFNYVNIAHNYDLCEDCGGYACSDPNCRESCSIKSKDCPCKPPKSGVLCMSCFESHGASCGTCTPFSVPKGRCMTGGGRATQCKNIAVDKCKSCRKWVCKGVECGVDCYACKARMHIDCSETVKHLESSYTIMIFLCEYCGDIYPNTSIGLKYHMERANQNHILTPYIHSSSPDGQKLKRKMELEAERLAGNVKRRQIEHSST